MGRYALLGLVQISVTSLLGCQSGASAPPPGVQTDSVALATPTPSSRATLTGKVNLWLVFDADANHAPLEDLFDCLINHTDFNRSIESWRKSPYRATPLRWDPVHGHGGSTVVPSGSCGQLFAPDPQCLMNAVLNDPNIGVPQDNDIILYIVHNFCGGGNNNGGSNGLPNVGSPVIGAGGAHVHIIAGTVGDGTAGGDNFPICAERVAVHEAFEGATDVSAADCCTGQTPGNLCDDCDPSCAEYYGFGPIQGPAGFGSYYVACNGKQYAAQRVIDYSGASSEWVPSSCTAARPQAQYGAVFVSQSFPFASTPIVIKAGATLSASITLRNSGNRPWDADTIFATTLPRHRKSAFAGADWLTASRLASCSGGAAPGDSCTFRFTFHAPSSPGTYKEYFGMLQEGEGWFSDPGQNGPPDNQLEAFFKVVP
jgi:hypothetical protein